MAAPVTFTPGRLDRSMAYDDAVFVSPPAFAGLLEASGKEGQAEALSSRGVLMTLRNLSDAAAPPVHYFVK